MLPALELRVRCLVADTLGVEIHELEPDVSLTDELAADSLDVAELAARLEADFGLVVPERVMDHLRTYGDLVRAANTAARERSAAPPRTDVPVPIWARLVSSHGELLRAELLTPYAAETIASQALRAGRGARLEITVAEDAGDLELAQVRAAFAWLAEQGLAVSVTTRDHVSGRGRSALAAFGASCEGHAAAG
jgi:acyl carrier protein